MKVAFLGDLHFGIRKGLKYFDNYFRLFFENIFFPYLIENDIKIVIQTGDQFDHRKFAPILALLECKKYFYDRLQELNIDYYSIIGNHDIMYKNEIKTNSPKILLNEYKNINIIDTPLTLKIFDYDICLIPWICKDNYDQSFNEIKNTKSTICLGHFEITGFSMHKGIVCKEGISPKIFDKFEFVFSGHYHHKSESNNIYYFGTPYQLSWNECDDIKGFHIFDFNNQELKFIENPYKLYNKIVYNENLDLMLYKNSYIKVIINEDYNEKEYQKFLTELDNIDPIDVTIIDNRNIQENIELEINESEDTLTIISKYIDNTNISNKNDIKTLLTNIYMEAMNIEI